MSDIKQQIFQELTALEDAASRLRSSANFAGRQTDLEVAILTEQVKTLRNKNKRAAEMVNNSLNILKKLQ